MALCIFSIKPVQKTYHFFVKFCFWTFLKKGLNTSFSLHKKKIEKEEEKGTLFSVQSKRYSAHLIYWWQLLKKIKIASKLWNNSSSTWFDKRNRDLSRQFHIIKRKCGRSDILAHDECNKNLGVFGDTSRPRIRLFIATFKIPQQSCPFGISFELCSQLVHFTSTFLAHRWKNSGRFFREATKDRKANARAALRTSTGAHLLYPVQDPPRRT